MTIHRFLTSPLFAPDGDEGGGGKTGDASATSSDKNTAADQQGKTANATGTNGGEDKLTLTPEQQRHVDNIIQQRLDRAQTAADKKAEAAAKKEADAKLDELTRTQKERDDFKSKLDDFSKQARERDAKDSVFEAAKKAGAGDGSPIWKMVKGDVAYDDDGKITNLDELIKDAKLIAPQLFKPNTSTADAGAGNRSSTAQGSDWIRATIDRRR